MSLSIPSTDALLGAVVAYLERELMPDLEGYHRFQTRIAANALKTVLREQQLGIDHARQDDRIAAELVGATTQNGSQAATLALAERLRDGTLALDTPGLVPCLRGILERQLAVDNPKWAAHNQGQ